MDQLIEGYLFGGLFKVVNASDIVLGYENPITSKMNDKMASQDV